MTKIYTRTGDKGETSLYTGQRLLKSDPLFEAIGTVDETNCAIGAAIAFFPKEARFRALREELETIQHALFDVGAALATPRTNAAEAKIEKTRFDLEEIALLEKWIDAIDKQVPPLKTFILPGGDPAGAMLHVARSCCRRAERLVLPINQRGDVSDSVIIYLNRLSDYLFMVSRLVNQLAGRPETLWEQHKAV